MAPKGTKIRCDPAFIPQIQPNVRAFMQELANLGVSVAMRRDKRLIVAFV